MSDDQAADPVMVTDFIHDDTYQMIKSVKIGALQCGECKSTNTEVVLRASMEGAHCLNCDHVALHSVEVYPFPKNRTF